MERRVAEYIQKRGLFRGSRRFRVDLHGVSVFGPRDEHVLIRWERVEAIRALAGTGVEVVAATATVVFPAGAFGAQPGELAARLEEARSIDRRGEVIAQLAGE